MASQFVQKVILWRTTGIAMTVNVINGVALNPVKSGALHATTLVQPETTVEFSILMNKIISDSLLASPGILRHGRPPTNAAPLLNDTSNALKKTIIWNPEAKSAVPELGTSEFFYPVCAYILMLGSNIKVLI
jgi:hypothetical protein